MIFIVNPRTNSISCIYFQFSVLLLVIFTIEIATGIVGYIRRNEVETMLENKLNSTMSDYYTNGEIKDTWDIAQHEVSIQILYLVFFLEKTKQT